MKILKFRNEEKTKYVEDILDADLIGIIFNNERFIIVKNHNNFFIALRKEDDGLTTKLKTETKVDFIKSFCSSNTPVILFDNEAEMMIWYNNID